MNIDSTGFDAFLHFSVLGLPLSLISLQVGLFLLFGAYIKISTVLAIVRAGFGFDSIPSAMVVGAISIALAYFVMFPTLSRTATAIDKVVGESVKKGSNAQLSLEERQAVGTIILDQWSKFLVRNCSPVEVERFQEIAKRIDSGKAEQGQSHVGERLSSNSKMASSPMRILMPAFLVTELKEAFATGLVLFLPFLVVDLVVSAILAAVGVGRLSPAVLAFPLKILLFVSLDGWSVITTNLISTYG